MKLILTCITLLLVHPALDARQAKQDTLNSPPLNYLRAEEDHSYLRRKGSDSIYIESDRFDQFKFIPLNGEKNIWLSLGGQYRPRFEFFNRQLLKKENGQTDYYSQRLALNASLNLTSHFRMFSELYHGYLSRPENIPVQDDPLALHQLFVESKINVGNSQLALRIGRQEMSYGISRLIGMREGPNIRLSFDALRFMFEKNTTSLHAFYGQEVLPNFKVLKDRRNRDMDFWGVYSKFFIKNDGGYTDLYYLGLNRSQASFEDGTGEERRHIVGLRRYGKSAGGFNWNTELIYQFGRFGNKNISSFAAEFDYHYTAINKRSKPTYGIKLDYIMGDKTNGDNRLNGFNSLFTNPTYFGLSATIAPTNLLDIHPSFSLNLMERMTVGVSWDFL